MDDLGDGVAAGNRRGRPRRKSDVVTLRQQAAPDHCLVAPAEMPLSSLLAVALRQVTNSLTDSLTNRLIVCDSIDEPVINTLSPGLPHLDRSSTRTRVSWP